MSVLTQMKLPRADQEIITFCVTHLFSSVCNDMGLTSSYQFVLKEVSD